MNRFAYMDGTWNNGKDIYLEVFSKNVFKYPVRPTAKYLSKKYASFNKGGRWVGWITSHSLGDGICTVQWDYTPFPVSSTESIHMDNLEFIYE